MLNRYSFNQILPWAAFPLTGLLLLIYPFLPEQKLVILPSQETYGQLYAGAQFDEKPEASWINDDTVWQCKTAISNDYQFCGINLMWREPKYHNGRDLSGFTKLNIKMDYQGNSNDFKLFFRNADPMYNRPEDGNSAQFNFTLIRSDHIKDGSISINLSELTVADWWMNQYHHPRKYAKTSFKHVNTIGIDFSGNNFQGETHTVSIAEISLSGPVISKSNYYLSILSVWMLTVFLYLVHSLVIEKRQKALLKMKNSKLKKQSEEYKSQSHYDSLTKQLNRRGFEQKLEGQTDCESCCNCIILVDLDHFKQINDTYGHAAGDLVLLQVANVLAENMRQQDIFARWGGEEFIIYSQVESLDNAVAFAEKLRNVVAQIKLSDLENKTITASIGIAKWETEQSFEQAFNYADKNLYLAKAQGRDQVCY